MRYKLVSESVFFITNSTCGCLFAYCEMSVCVRFFLIVFKDCFVVCVLVIVIAGDLHIRYTF
jgi:hypothetical protein